MKKTILILLLHFSALSLSAQWLTSGTNIYNGNNGNVGIGTSLPIGKLHVVDEAKNYYVNRMIAGYSGDNVGINYLLLHQMHTNTTLAEHYVVGKIFAERGGVAASNRKWVIDVSTASAYQSNRGSIVSYNESSRLVTLWYGGKKYVAAEIMQFSTLYNFSFTGYAYNEMLKIVGQNEVSDVQTFVNKDPINMNGGDLFVGEYIGIGTNSPNYELDVVGTIRAHQVLVNTQKGADFVFDDDYHSRPLEEVEQFITENKHLPDIAPASSMQQNGVDMGELQIQLLQKIEELTLYVIELEKRDRIQQKEIEMLKQAYTNK